MTGGGSIGRPRSPTSPGPDFVPVVAESHVGCATPAIAIEIGSAIVRVEAGVELAFLGKVLRLLKAMR